MWKYIQTNLQYIFNIVVILLIAGIFYLLKIENNINDNQLNIIKMQSVKIESLNSRLDTAESKLNEVEETADVALNGLYAALKQLKLIK